MRLFIAVDINNINIEKFQNYLIQKFIFNSYHVRPIQKNNLHITIKFLGEKTDLETNDIISDLAKIHFDSFDMVFNNVGIFPDMKFPRIIWVGLDDKSSKKLNDIFYQINDVLKKCDNIKKKSNALHTSINQKFFPHLTIFRIHNNYTIPNFLSSFPDRVISEDELNTISLKKSTLTSNGSIYSDLFNIYANKRNV